MKEFLVENIVFVTCASLVTALVSLVLLYLNYRYIRKRHSKLFFQPIEPMNVYNTSYVGFKGFDLKYKGNPISNSILYFSGELVCKGKDIDTIGNEIQVKAPEGYNWIDIIVVNQPKNNNASATITQTDNQYAVLSFDKFRKNKSFKINALLENCTDRSLKTVEDLIKSFEFDHTISDTDDVQISYANILPPTPISIMSRFFVLMLLLIVGVVSYYSGFNFIWLTMLIFSVIAVMVFWMVFTAFKLWSYRYVR